MRVLVAFEEDYRVYQDATACTIRELRPHVEVSDVDLGELEAEMAHLVPDLVICSRPKKATDAAGRVHAWLELPTGHDRSAKLCFDGECSEVGDPGLDELLRIVDETERLVQAKAGFRNP